MVKRERGGGYHALLFLIACCPVCIIIISTLSNCMLPLFLFFFPGAFVLSQSDL